MKKNLVKMLVANPLFMEKLRRSWPHPCPTSIEHVSSSWHLSIFGKRSRDGKPQGQGSYSLENSAIIPQHSYPGSAIKAPIIQEDKSKILGNQVHDRWCSLPHGASWFERTIQRHPLCGNALNVLGRKMQTRKPLARLKERKALGPN